MMLHKIFVNTANEPPSPPELSFFYNCTSSPPKPPPFSGTEKNPLCFTQIFSLLLSTAFALVFFCFAYVLSGSLLAYSARLILGPNLVPHTDFYVTAANSRYQLIYLVPRVLSYPTLSLSVEWVGENPGKEVVS